MIFWLTDKGGSRQRLGEKGYLLARAKQAGLPVPDGFVIENTAVRSLYDARLLRKMLNLGHRAASDLKLVNQLLRQLVRSIDLKPDHPLARQMSGAFDQLCGVMKQAGNSGVAVLRLSADHDPMRELAPARTILPIQTSRELLDGVIKLLHSFLDRAVLTDKIERGEISQSDFAPALLVQQLVDAEVAGVASSFDPVAHDADTVVIEASLGLGGPVLSGEITPDRYKLAKGSLQVIDQSVAAQSWQLVVSNGQLRHRRVQGPTSHEPKLSEEELITLARLVTQSEALLKAPVELEWAKDARQCSLVDLRVVSRSSRRKATLQPALSELTKRKAIAARGIGASPGIAAGPVKLLHRAQDVAQVVEGDVVVSELTSPAFVPSYSKAAAVITETGGINSHAAVAAREIGIPCVVATKRATHTLKDSQLVTVDGSQGLVYAGSLPPELVAGEQRHPTWAQASSRYATPITATKLYVNLTDPSIARAVSELPVDGVGLLRAEFMIAALGEHPQALLAGGKREPVLETLLAKLTAVAQAFAPRPVVYRLSDFKTSEYRNLKGGDGYEPKEENPALGFRGARRLIDQPSWLALELELIRRARDELACRNLWLMVPFVRTPEELAILADKIQGVGLRQSADFKLWMMVEVPSNVILIRDFLAQGIDGISIGTNDLTSLIMGVDRDAGRLSSLYPATHPAVLKSLVHVVTQARQYAVASSICGQAAAVYPEVVEALVQSGITSISVSPDAVHHTRELIASVERHLLLERVIW